jgi:hypothetical protein
MKKLIAVLAVVIMSAVVYAPCAHAVLPQQVDGDIRVTVLGTAEFTVLSFKFRGVDNVPTDRNGNPIPAGDPWVDLGGDLDFGTINTAVILDPTQNPYGTGLLRCGADHYMQLRFYCNNNTVLWRLRVQVMDGGPGSPLFASIPAPGGSSPNSILNVKNFNMNVFESTQTTNYPVNLTNMRDPATAGSQPGDPVRPGTDYIMYNCANAGVYTNDLWTSIIALDNVSPSAPGGEYTALISYIMEAIP